jgi:hypothetical protein
MSKQLLQVPNYTNERFENARHFIQHVKSGFVQGRMLHRFMLNGRVVVCASSNAFSFTYSEELEEPACAYLISFSTREYDYEVDGDEVGYALKYFSFNLDEPFYAFTRPITQISNHGRSDIIYFEQILHKSDAERKLKCVGMEQNAPYDFMYLNGFRFPLNS